MCIRDRNGAAGVTGGGGIELARINAPGVNFEQSPGHVELAKGIKAVVEGKEVTADKPKEETAGKEPTKDKPKKEVPAPSKPPTKPDPTNPDPPPDPKPEPAMPTVVSFMVFKSQQPIGEWKMVVVKLSCSDPQNYSVSVGSTPLKRRPSSPEYFSGDVPEKDAYEGNVKISKK